MAGRQAGRRASERASDEDNDEDDDVNDSRNRTDGFLQNNRARVRIVKTKAEKMCSGG